MKSKEAAILLNMYMLSIVHADKYEFFDVKYPLKHIHTSVFLYKCPLFQHTQLIHCMGVNLRNLFIMPKENDTM